jgi:ribosomal protein L22
MSAEEQKDVAPEPAEEPKAAKKPAATPQGGTGKKAAAKKASGKGEGEPKAKASSKKAAAKDAEAEKPHEGENAPEKQRRRKKAAEPEAAAPGDATEAKAAAKAKPAKEPAPKAAPRSKAGGAKPARRRVVSARARYVRTSARKARMVCGHLRGKSVAEARAILAFTPREVARDWSKLLESAVANAESNHELLQDDLIVREAYADEGPTIKRFRPRAMGRATPIRKRTSHLTITLTAAPENGSGRRKG